MQFSTLYRFIMTVELGEGKNEQMMEEIRRRVLERYNELQGIADIRENTQANLQALHEITSLPMREIQDIAADVSAKYEMQPEQIGKPKKIKPKELESYLPDPSDTLSFETLTNRQILLRRSFAPHAIAYGFTNGVLGILNYMTSPNYPWVMFPISFWGIGLAIHYLVCVSWPKARLKRKITESCNEVVRILEENWRFFQIKRYQKRAARKPFINAVYRLLVSEADDKTLIDYLGAVEDSLPVRLSTDSELRQIAIQVAALKRRYVKRIG